MNWSIEVHESVAPLYEEWRQLWLQSPANPFLHPGWSLAFEKMGAGSIRVCILVVRQDGRLCAVLPLRWDDDGVYRTLSAPRADYEDALSLREVEEEVCQRLAHWLMGRRFELGEMPHNSKLANVLRGSGAKWRLSAECPGIALSLEVMEQLRRRDSLRRHERKLGKLGQLKLELVGVADRGEALRQLMDQHISRWLAAGGPSLFLDSRNESFYHALIDQRDFAEFACLHRLWAGEKPVALHFGLVAPSAFIWYKPTFDLNLATMGPGEVLFRHLLEESWQLGRGYFDFTRGGEAFKKRFATQVERNQYLAHRLPKVRPWLDRWKRRAIRLKKLLGHGWRMLLAQLERHDELYFQLQSHPSQSAPPAGSKLTFGEIDLVWFGAQHRWHPKWVNAARMKRVVERRQRGDRVLTLTDAEGKLQHVSWVRFDQARVRGDVSVMTLNPPREVAVIYDCWTASECRGKGCYPWALQWLAHELGSAGHEVWIYTSAVNIASARGIEKAGVASRVVLPYGSGANHQEVAL